LLPEHGIIQPVPIGLTGLAIGIGCVEHSQQPCSLSAAL